MHEAIAALVHPVLVRGLELKGRLDRGESPAFATEQAILEGLLTAGLAEETASTASDGESRTIRLEGAIRRSTERLMTVRYALACWLDELFILESPWETRWNERKLEVTLNGTNDRAWKFWELARRPETRLDRDLLETFFLCVMLGFRGGLRDRPTELEDWITSSRAQLTKIQGLEWTPPPELTPPTRVPPLGGGERLRTMVVAGGLVFLLLTPVVAFFLIYQLGR
jgi:type IV/VI secretion system ImpK/VasF family protein